jgi:hypothetical protein
MVFHNGPKQPIRGWLMVIRPNRPGNKPVLRFSPFHPIGEIHPFVNVSLFYQRRQGQRKFFSNYHAKSFAPTDNCRLPHGDGTEINGKTYPLFQKLPIQCISNDIRSRW